jgi:hypothetical protein
VAEVASVAAEPGVAEVASVAAEPGVAEVASVAAEPGVAEVASVAAEPGVVEVASVPDADRGQGADRVQGEGQRRGRGMDRGLVVGQASSSVVNQFVNPSVIQFADHQGVDCSLIGCFQIWMQQCQRSRKERLCSVQAAGLRVCSSCS